MAVDTRFKRFNMIAFGGGEILHVLPEADGAIDADDRAQLLGLYGGNALGPPVDTGRLPIGPLLVNPNHLMRH